MAKGKVKSIFVKLLSGAGTGFFYVTRKNPKNVPERLTLRKYDPVVVSRPAHRPRSAPAPPPRADVVPSLLQACVSSPFCWKLHAVHPLLALIGNQKGEGVHAGADQRLLQLRTGGSAASSSGWAYVILWPTPG